MILTGCLYGNLLEVYTSLRPVLTLAPPRSILEDYYIRLKERFSTDKSVSKHLHNVDLQGVL